MFVRLPEGGHVWAEGVISFGLERKIVWLRMKNRLQQIEKSVSVD